MNDLYEPLFLLNLTKHETQLLLALYIIYENDNKKEKYTIEEIAKLVGSSALLVEDTLNKLMMKNIIGRIVYESITDRSVRENFDGEFLSTLYHKDGAFSEGSALDRVGFYIDNITKSYYLNPVTKSWKYIPKAKSVTALKRLQKVNNSPFVEYLLKSFNFGKPNDKRKASHAKLNGWDIKQVVEIFKSRYKTAYGNSYDAGTKDYAHMKKLLEQLSNDCFPKNDIGVFIDYAFERAVGRDYVLQIAGLKYYANEYNTNILKNRR